MQENPTKRAVTLSEKSSNREECEMLHFRPGSQVWQLITLLSVVGEFPFRSLGLLGNERVLKVLVTKLSMPQTVRNPQTEMEMTCRILTVTGRSSFKTVRLYKAALPILNWVHPEASRYYMEAFWNHRFPGDSAHRERNHRVSEAVMLCMRAGIESRPYWLPALQNNERLSVIPDSGSFYLAKDIKKIGQTEMNKTMFTRMVGAIFSCGRCYAVYNTRAAAMKWSGMGEFKALHNLIEVGRLNAGTDRIDSAVLFGESEETALKTLLESDRSRRLEFRFDSIYRHIHFVPLDERGIRQLHLLSVPDWKEKLLDLLFEPEDRSFDKGLFEYDACVGGVYILSHLDGDIARLIRFREGIQNQDGSFEILCYPHQTHFLQEYMDQLAGIKTIDMDVVEAELGSERRNLFGG
ncbi:hypothetical protein AALA98_00655 [Lachnospiraceae bacterium 45-W7]